VSEHVSKTIELVNNQIRELEEQVAAKKQLVNNLCGLAGIDAYYPDEQLAASGSFGPLPADAYYGKPLATAVREVLERRKRGGLSAATVNEIFEALTDGGYHFNTKNVENAKRGLYQSLTKNSTTFHRLPNGSYGLLEWYPGAKSSVAKANGRSIQLPSAEELGISEEEYEEAKTAKASFDESAESSLDEETSVF